MISFPSQVSDTESNKSNVANNLRDIVAALPREIAELIPRMLDVIEYHRFSAVCKTWRSIAVAAKQSQLFSLQQLPWLMLSSNNSFEDDRHGFFSPYHGKFLKLKLPEVRGCRCCGYSWGWLIMANEIGDNFLLNPFSRLQIQLPSQTTLPSSWLPIDDPDRWFRGPYIRKAILLTPPAISPTASNTSNCIVVAIYALKSLCFCRPGDEAWTNLNGLLDLPWRQLYPGHRDICIRDVILFNHQLYAVTDDYELVLIELEPHPKCTNLKAGMPCHEGHKGLVRILQLIYLVESCGELLMVVRHSNVRSRAIITTTFKMFRLDWSGPRWIEIDSLGDQMLFVGTSTNISLSASPFSGFRGNCIYFTDDSIPYISDDDPTAVYDMGVFSLDDGSIKSFLPTESGMEFLSTKSSPVWYMPSQF